MKKTIHLIGNAHLDPVWLWDSREGLNEGIATCQTMVDLLKEFPDFRFIRGEAAVYQHIERHASGLFRQIQALVAAGRWEIVGGNYVQPDTNLPSTEVLLRQFVRGKKYFREKFDVEVTTAWAADSFGHSAGLPEILAAAGMDSFAFTRPPRTVLSLPKPVFWWSAKSGARILCYRPDDRWYGTERDEMEARLDRCIAEATRHDLDHVACFYGLGNHGGGPSRRHLRSLEAWGERHPEVQVKYSGLKDLFAALRTEGCTKGPEFIPTVTGELNFCLRGCSASAAKLKFAYRRTENQAMRAERAIAVAAAGTRSQPGSILARTWDSLLFNSFHDILPGSSIERAYDDQLAELGGGYHEAQQAESAAIMDLAATLDTRPPSLPTNTDMPTTTAMLVWNPHPWTLSTHVEIEAALDYRPLHAFNNRSDEVHVKLLDEKGRPVPFQRIAEESEFMITLPWRRRVIAPLTLPPLGWRLLHYGLGEVVLPLTKKQLNTARAIGRSAISNDILGVKAPHGDSIVSLLRNGQPWWPKGLEVRLYEDRWGAWGGMTEEKDSWLLTKERERWVITQTQVLESGPERAALWVRFAGARSHLDLTFLLRRDRPVIEVRARTFVNERSARLKLILPIGGRAEFEVPGGTVVRSPCGEVPGGRWIKVQDDLGFASDALYGFETTDQEFRATILRATRYASDTERGPAEVPWQPAVDVGEHRVSFLLTPDLPRLPQFAAELEMPAVTTPIPSRCGKARSVAAQIGKITSGLNLLSLQAVDRGRFLLRAQNGTRGDLASAIVWFGQALDLGLVKPGEIVTWSLTGLQRWRARRVNATRDFGKL